MTCVLMIKSEQKLKDHHATPKTSFSEGTYCSTSKVGWAIRVYWFAMHTEFLTVVLITGHILNYCYSCHLATYCN